MAQRKRKVKRAEKPVEKPEISDQERIERTQEYIKKLKDEDRESGVDRDDVADLQHALDDYEKAVEDETAARAEGERIRRLRKSGRLT
jgi:hypothetical protein